MNTLLKPSFAADVNIDEILSADYDIVLVALGYEQRSRNLACRLEGSTLRKVAIPFEADRILSYDENKRILEDLDFEIVDLCEAEVLPWWRQQLMAQDVYGGDSIRVCIDISSLTRLRMARLLEGLMTAPSNKAFLVDFVYTVAEFSPPPEASETATVCGAVSSFLAGWPNDPEKSVAAIIGLGYELEKAVGAIEYLEPANKVLISPISKDERFDREVRLANQDLLSSASGGEAFAYPIGQPTQCLELLDALIHGMKDEFRIIAIPFGPKIFALCCMLMACRYYPEVGIWRISAETARVPKDQAASATTIGLRVRFAPPADPPLLEN